MSSKESYIREQALAAGFDVVAITKADFGEEPGQHLHDFIAKKRHGEMAWLAEKAHWREHPNSLWPEARSVVMLAINYGPDEDPRALLTQKNKGVISVYARGKDYHDIVKKRLKQIARAMVGEFGGDVKVFVDTAAVMEKPLAAAAGIGWQGKHTNLLSREFGSWLFLGCIFSTLELMPDNLENGDCGSCRACLDICPTNAFPAPYQLDARRCISYLTIETKGHIDEDLRPLIGNRIYGCDDCLAVCPWNKYAKKASVQGLQSRPELIGPPLQDLAVLDDAAFRTLFAGSPVKRLGRDRFVRNVFIAIGNSGNAGFLDLIPAALTDGSPLVRAMGVWAASQLALPEQIDRLRRQYLPAEQDADVLEEWKKTNRSKPS
jgi:epoxyqueuosine reductase